MRLQRSFYALLCCLIFSAFTCQETQIQNLITASDDATPDGMVLIPAGEATIGAPAGEIPEVFFEKKVALRQQTVFVDEFLIDTHEVTFAEFLKFVEATGINASYSYASEPNYPVEVDFQGAKAYAQWAGKRLPTEAEWEKAARGGLEGARYPWGNEFPTDDHARIQGEQYRTNIVSGPVVVGSYPANGYGLHDMAGNMSEWVDAEPIQNHRPVYGGSWLSGSSWFCRIYIRELRPASIHTRHGFRCARDAN